MKRYQECSPIHKLWRQRWYVIVPFMFVFDWITGVKIYNDDDESGKSYHMAPAWLIWSFCVSRVQTNKMKFWWTSDEVFNNIRNKK